MLKRSTLLLAAVLVVAGCGKPVLDGPKIEKEVKKRITSLGVDVKSVSCPDDQEVKKGDRFSCTVTASEDGSSGKLQLEVESTKKGGTIRYVSDFMDRDSLQSGIGDLVTKRTGAQDVSVTCPAIIERTKGTKATCTAKSGSDSVDLEVTMNDDQGHYSIKQK